MFFYYSYVFEYRRCIQRYTNSCSDSTLNQVTINDFPFNAVLQQIAVAVDACQSDRCDPNPCQSNGTCFDNVSNEVFYRVILHNYIWRLRINFAELL